MQSSDSLKSDRSRVRRVAKRGIYDRATINAILDAHIMCQLAFVYEGRPEIIPTFYARDGQQIYLHGSRKSRMLMALRDGAEFCFSVSHLDALVVARSVFHHSANYRSVTLYGQAREITDEAERMHAFEVLTNHLLPGRWEEARLPNEKELKATIALALPIEEGAAKVRTGPPVDEEEDYALDIWAGLLPLKMTASAPIADPRLKEGIKVPKSVQDTRKIYDSAD